MWGVTKDGHLCRKLTDKVIMKVGMAGIQRLADISEFAHHINFGRFDDILIKGDVCLELEGVVYHMVTVNHMYKQYGSKVEVSIFEDNDIVISEHAEHVYSAYLDGTFYVFNGCTLVDSKHELPFSGKIVSGGFIDKFTSHLEESLSFLEFRKIKKDDNGVISFS